MANTVHSQQPPLPGHRDPLLFPLLSLRNIGLPEVCSNHVFNLFFFNGIVIYIHCHYIEVYAVSLKLKAFQ